MNRLLVSYRTLRRTVGILAMALPLLMLIAGFQPSISEYYITYMRNVFVGILCVIGLFLFAYRGYDLLDNIAGDLCCIFALGVAFFPTTSAIGWIHIVHLSSATLLFIMLAIFTGFLFTKGNPIPTREKLVRNRVYRICCLVIVSCIVSLAVYINYLETTSLARFRPIFWLEAIALWAFGISWFVKGDTLWKDKTA